MSNKRNTPFYEVAKDNLKDEDRRKYLLERRKFEKRIINGKVGVVYSPLSIWSAGDSFDDAKNFLMFDSIIVDYITNNSYFEENEKFSKIPDNICEKIKERCPYDMCREYNINHLNVAWIPVGTCFAISIGKNGEIITINTHTV